MLGSSIFFCSRMPADFKRVSFPRCHYGIVFPALELPALACAERGDIARALEGVCCL